MSAAPRTGAQRKADALAKLGERHAGVWVASASEGGRAHLVPLSFCWSGGCVVLAVEPASVTARNITSSGAARLALGTSRDVVMVDTGLASSVDVATAADLAGNYAAQADWDPRQEGSAYVFLELRPRRIQVWRGADEIPGRTIMRDGEWLA
jgi:flavin reductase (DIM6/NTAB) family NADH-FMN oxidoreductase RutF